MTRDMTVGNPTKLILFFSIPLLIGNIFQQFYSMADTIIVGRTLGYMELAAVGATGALSFLILGFVTGLTGGFAVITAQRFGANDEDGLRQSVAMSIMLSIGFTILITVLSMLTARPLLIFMNTPPEILDNAYNYIIVIYAGTVAAVFYNMISSILRALGDSKTPLYFLIIASILNVILDFVFIMNFSMGVAGAGYATVIAQIVSGVLCIIYTAKRFPVLHLTKSDFKFDRQSALLHLKIGLPMALQFSITAIGVMVLQSVLNTFGTTVVAAYTAASKVEQLAIQPTVTLGVTIATFSAQNLGAGKLERIKEGVKKCSILSIIFSSIGAAVVILFGGDFTKLFVSGDQPEVIAYSKLYLNTVAVFFVVLGLLFVYRNVLQGIGNAFVPMMAGACELIMRVIVSFTLSYPLGFLGVCLANPIAWIGATIPLAITYFRTIRKMLAKQNQISKP